MAFRRLDFNEERSVVNSAMAEARMISIEVLAAVDTGTQNQKIQRTRDETAPSDWATFQGEREMRSKEQASASTLQPACRDLTVKTGVPAAGRALRRLSGTPGLPAEIISSLE